MIAYLGMPPLEYTRRSADMRHVFDEDGLFEIQASDEKIHLTDLIGYWKWKGKHDIPPLSLEKSVQSLSGENKQQFLEFVRSMLRWLPEERKSATELLKDPWLNRATT